MTRPQLKTVDDVFRLEHQNGSGLTSDSKEQFLTGSNYKFTEDEIQELSSSTLLKFVHIPKPDEDQA